MCAHARMHAHMSYVHIQCASAAYTGSLRVNHWGQCLNLMGTWNPPSSAFLGGETNDHPVNILPPFGLPALLFSSLLVSAGKDEVALL